MTWIGCPRCRNANELRVLRDESPHGVRMKCHKCQWIGWHSECWTNDDLIATPDPEHQARIDAQRVTWEWKQKSGRRLDAGKQPITDGPLFGGPAQRGLFDDAGTEAASKAKRRGKND